MKTFLNFTELDDNEAKLLLQEKKDLVLRGEADRKKRQVKDTENRNLWLNRIWTDDQLKDFFNAYDLTPYNIGVHRPLINNLISRQRSQKISFDFIPSDIHSYKRHREGKQEFIESEMAKEESVFSSPSEAGEYYDKYADDEYANAVTALLHNVRQENKAKYVETEVFQSGIVSGLDFFKAVYGRQHNRNGGIEISRRSQAAVFFDESGVEYDLRDIEYIGEVHRLYKNQLKTMYPDYAQDIEEFFKHYTNKKRPISSKDTREWGDFFDFNSSNVNEARLNVAELWTLESEDRFVVVDVQNSEQRVIEYGIEEDEIFDRLMSFKLIELEQEARENTEVAELLTSPNVKQEIAAMVEEQYEIHTTTEPIFYKTVFSYNSLLEHVRTPLPHGSHPYFPFYAQFTEGEFTSIMDDIKDLVIAVNKALAFRELMMAHGAKGLVIVDEKAFASSGYDVNDIAEQYTSIGGVMMIKLKPGQRISDIIDVVTTVGDGLEAINSLLADLDQRLMQVSGVTFEQLGIVQRQTTNSGYRAQVAEGETNNGLIFDNFYRSMESFYNDKVIPLVAEMMATQGKRVIRRLGDDHKPWIEIDPEETFDFFDTSIRTGQYNTVLRPITDNPQIQEERSSKYMEMAMAGLLDPEIAIEHSTDPERYKILKKMKEKERERAARMAYNEFTVQEFFEAAASSQLPFEELEKLIDGMKKEKAKELNKDKSAGQQAQRRQGGMGATAAPNIRSQAGESQRLGQISRTEQ